MGRARKTKAAAKVTADAPAPKTEGQRALLALPDSHSAIGERLGTSKQSVHQWRTGERIPGATMRQRVAEVLAIPIEAWDRLPGTTDDADPPPFVPPIGGGEVAELEALIRQVAEERRKGSLTAAHLRDNIKLESQLREQRQRALERAEMQETRIVTGHPFWKRLRGALLEALRQHPDATRDVIAVLEALRA